MSDDSSLDTLYFLKMRIFKILSLVIIYSIVSNLSSAQSIFIKPDPSSQEDEFLTGAVELPGGSILFCGNHVSSTTTHIYADGVLLKTNRNGSLVGQKSINHTGNKRSELLNGLFYRSGFVYSIGTHSDTNSINGHGYRWLTWRKLDTMLNVLSEKAYRIDTGTRDLYQVRAVQNGSTILGACWTLDEATGDNSRGILFALNDTGRLSDLRQTDSSFFAYAGHKATTIFLSGIEAEINGSGAVVSGTFEFSGSTPSSYSTKTLALKIDLDLHLIDTVEISATVDAPQIADTTVTSSSVTCLPLPSGDYMIGTQFNAPLGQLGNANYIGTSRYNRSSGKHRTSGLVPLPNSYDEGTISASGHGLVRFGAYVYSFGTSWDGDISLFSGPESQLLLGKYDTSGNLLRSFKFGRTGYRYIATHVQSLADGGLLLLGSSQNFNLYSNIPQRDFLAIRLDSTGTPLTVMDQAPNDSYADRFSVFPNPTSGAVTVTDNLNKLVSLQLFSSTGELLGVYSSQNGIIRLSLDQQPSGVYLLLIRDNDGIAWPHQILHN